LVENEKVLNEIPKALSEGVTSVKTFLANKGEKSLGRA
jgi:hypothetical protein